MLTPVNELKKGSFFRGRLGNTRRNSECSIGAFQVKRRNKTTTKTDKNPNWLEANQLAIYKCSWEVEPGTTRNKFNEWSEWVLNPGSPALKACALTTGPNCPLTPETQYVDHCHG